MKGAPKQAENVACRFGHAFFGARDARGVAGQEVIHRLRGRQFADRRQHAIGVAGQHDDVLRQATDAAGAGIRDEIDRVAGAAVFRQRARRRNRAVCVTGSMHDIFQNRAEAARGRINFRLHFRAQANGLGVAAAFEIEHAWSVQPCSSSPISVREASADKRGLAGARQAKENRHIAIRTNIGRSMHRQDTLGRHQVVHHRENGLLDFAGIGRAADHSQLLGEIQHDERIAARAVDAPVRP